MSVPENPVRGHVTIEKHSKSLKAQQVLAVLALLVGIVMTFANMGTTEGGGLNAAAGTGMFASFVGMMWLAVTKVRMWWHHG